MQQSSRRIRAHIAACLLASGGFASVGHAAIVHSGPINLPVPSNIDGLYLNLVTGVGGSSNSQVPGWDFNGYTSSTPANNFRLFGNTNGPQYLSVGGTIAGPFKIPAGTSIGPGATFFQPNGTTDVGPQLALNSSDNLIGVRFINENGGGIHFGWLRLQVGATAATRAVVAYAYESTPATPIAAGDTGNTPPTIATTAAFVTAGSASGTVTIAAVGDAEDAAAPTVTIDGGNSSTANGVTISGLTVDPVSEVVSATVVAVCGASDASFTLRATDSAAAFSEATLNVTVAPDTPPTLAYPSASVAFGGTVTVAPSSGPSDNGTVVTIAGFSQGTYTGNFGTVNTTGVVEIYNAQPPGDHTLQIRITDNCGLFSDVPLSVAVADAADLAIAKNVDASGLGDGVLVYTIAVSNAGPSTATGAIVTDTFVSPQSGVAWTCSTTGGGTCGASGSGDINEAANVPPGGVVTYTAVVDVPVPLGASFDNTATVAPPAGLTDPDTSNNSSTVTVQSIAIFADGFETLVP